MKGEFQNTLIKSNVSLHSEMPQTIFPTISFTPKGLYELSTVTSTDHFKTFPLNDFSMSLIYNYQKESKTASWASKKDLICA